MKSIINPSPQPSSDNNVDEQEEIVDPIRTLDNKTEEGSAPSGSDRISSASPGQVVEEGKESLFSEETTNEQNSSLSETTGSKSAQGGIIKSLTGEFSLPPEDEELFHQMMEVGAFYGRSKSRTNPLMRKFIVTTRSGFEIINLQETIKHLRDAGSALQKIASDGGVILMVGTTPAVKGGLKKVAMKLELPYVTERWLGGTLTNFKTISKRILYLKKLKEDKVKGGFEKYTKKERLKIDRETARLDRLLGGIETLDKMPDALFIADVRENEYAAKEARQKNIPVIAIVNTDTNPTLLDYVIPVNNKNPKSLEIVFNFLEEAIMRGKDKAAKAEEVKSAQKDESSTPASTHTRGFGIRDKDTGGRDEVLKEQINASPEIKIEKDNKKV